VSDKLGFRRAWWFGKLEKWAADQGVANPNDHEYYYGVVVACFRRAGKWTEQEVEEALAGRERGREGFLDGSGLIDSVLRDGVPKRSASFADMLRLEGELRRRALRNLGIDDRSGPLFPRLPWEAPGD
jgi:hypothetical protein